MIFQLPSGYLRIARWETRPVFDGFRTPKGVRPSRWGLKIGPLVLEYSQDGKIDNAE